MSLQGSIQTVALPHILNLLASTSMSGELTLVTERGEGRLWLDAGRLSGHDVAHCPEPVDALFELLRAEDGTFSFSTRAERPGGDIRDLAPLIEAATDRLTEWHQIAAVIPSVAHTVRLVDDPAVERIDLDKTQWALVLAIGEGNPVRRVLDRRQLGEFDGCLALKQLVDGGLAIVEEPVKALPPVALEVTWSAPAPAADWSEPVADVEAPHELRPDALRALGAGTPSSAALEVVPGEVSLGGVSFDVPSPAAADGAVEKADDDSVDPVADAWATSGAATDEASGFVAPAPGSIITESGIDSGAVSDWTSQAELVVPEAALGGPADAAEGEAAAEAVGAEVLGATPSWDALLEHEGWEGEDGADPGFVFAAEADGDAAEDTSSGEDGEVDEAPAAEPINKSLLLKFLSSVRS